MYIEANNIHQLNCIIVTIGTAIQTGSVNMGMFLAGRAIAGFAVGGMVGTVPIYLSEIAAPKHRGLIAGVSGCGISFCTLMSNWGMHTTVYCSENRAKNADRKQLVSLAAMPRTDLSNGDCL